MECSPFEAQVNVLDPYPKGSFWGTGIILFARDYQRRCGLFPMSMGVASVRIALLTVTNRLLFRMERPSTLCL